MSRHLELICPPYTTIKAHRGIGMYENDEIFASCVLKVTDGFSLFDRIAAVGQVLPEGYGVRFYMEEGLTEPQRTDHFGDPLKWATVREVLACGNPQVADWHARAVWAFLEVLPPGAPLIICWG